MLYYIFGNIKTARCGDTNVNFFTYFIDKNFKDKPLVLQFEIANELAHKNYVIFEIKEHRNKGEYLDTNEVAQQALKIMDKQNLEKPVLVAHPFHVPRVDAVCKKLGIKTIVPSGLNSIRFDPDSEQEWTRNPKAWGIREELAILESKKRGLI